jgi:hypothetical protein
MITRHRTADALLDGRTHGDGIDLAGRDAEIATFIAALRDDADRTPAPAPNAALVAIFDSGRDVRPLRAIAGDERRRRDAIVERARRRWTRTIAAPSIAGAVLFGGLAAAGALPAPLQHAAAHAAAHLGVTLPGSASPAHGPTPSAGVQIGGSTNAHAPGSSAPGSRPHGDHTTVTGGAHAHVTTPPASTQVPTSVGVTLTTPTIPRRVVPPTLPHLTVPTLPEPTGPITVPSVPLP